MKHSIQDFESWLKGEPLLSNQPRNRRERRAMAKSLNQSISVLRRKAIQGDRRCQRFFKKLQREIENAEEAKKLAEEEAAGGVPDSDAVVPGDGEGG